MRIVSRRRLLPLFHHQSYRRFRPSYRHPKIPVVTVAATAYNTAIKTVENAISTYQQLGNTIRARLEAALNHHHTITRFDAPPIPDAGGGTGPNTYTWIASVSNLASDPRNWLLNGKPQAISGQIPGQGPSGIFDTVLFDSFYTNDGIEWDNGGGKITTYNFSTMDLGDIDDYTGLQTVDKGIKVQMNAGNGSSLVTNVADS